MWLLAAGICYRTCLDATLLHREAAAATANLKIAILGLGWHLDKSDADTCAAVAIDASSSHIVDFPERSPYPLQCGMSCQELVVPIPARSPAVRLRRATQRRQRGSPRVIGSVLTLLLVNGFVGQEAYLVHSGNCVYELAALHR